MFIRDSFPDPEDLRVKWCRQSFEYGLDVDLILLLLYGA